MSVMFRRSCPVPPSRTSFGSAPRRSLKWSGTALRIRPLRQNQKRVLSSAVVLRSSPAPLSLQPRSSAARCGSAARSGSAGCPTRRRARPSLSPRASWSTRNTLTLNTSNRGIRGNSRQGLTAISERSDDGFARASDESLSVPLEFSLEFHQLPRPPAGANQRARNREATMTINLNVPDIRELKPRITVFGVGGAGGNAVNNMITAGLQGVDFVVANTDAQALTMSKAQRIVQMGTQVTQGLGAGSQPDVGAAAAQEVIDEIRDHLAGANMVFVTAGMGGGTGTGAAPVIAKTARDMGILTVGVVTKPFHFEGQRRMRTAEAGIAELHKVVDTLLIIPNQNLFRVANEKTTFADAFAMADQVLYSGVACITDLMVKEGLINLDFADVRAVMKEMGKAMMGTGEASAA